MSASKHIFFISGLGADHRAFARIRIEGDHKITHLKWIIPEKSDSLADYARKMSEPIKNAENPIVIGLSLGGMIASEMTTFIPDLKVILVSSIKSPEERSTILKLGDKIRAQHLVHIGAMKKMAFLWGWMKFKIPKKDSAHMIQMMRDQDNRFMKWALLAAPRWKGQGDESRIHHIHGNKDLMFPVKRIKNARIIEGGTHIMVYSKADEVSSHINQILKHEI